jgi:hypothetical protein
MNAPTIQPAPIRKTLVVKADIERAFAVFTSRMGSWWPRSHSTAARIEFEHRHLERLGANAGAVRELLNSGWAAILDLYANRAAASPNSGAGGIVNHV